MDFVVDNVTYELIRASDVIRDGLGMELWTKGRGEMLGEIFRNDDKKKIEFSIVACNLPFEVIEIFIAAFEKNVGREFQD